MATLFEKIYQGELPGFLLAETDLSFAILNKYPALPGHTLVLPKKAVPSIWELNDAAFQDVFRLAKRLEPAIHEATSCTRVGMVVEGFGVPDHAHLHLIPLYDAGDIATQGTEMSDDQLLLWQERITLHLAQEA